MDSSRDHTWSFSVRHFSAAIQDELQCSDFVGKRMDISHFDEMLAYDLESRSDNCGTAHGCSSCVESSRLTSTGTQSR